MSGSGWDHMSEWWDHHSGEEGDLWHRALTDAPLLRLVGEVSGKCMLDLACGNGHLSRRFAGHGATVIGVDANAPLIERGKPQRGTGTPRYYLSCRRCSPSLHARRCCV